MEEDVLIAALAGLLHDVWKFAWQAQANASNASASSEEIESIRQSFQSEFVPVRFHGELQSEPIQKIAQLASKLGDIAQENAAPTRLRSIFSRLADHRDDAFIPLNRLNPKTEDALFPKPLNSFPSNSQPEYAELWNRFKEASDQLKITELQNTEQYLFDHMRVNAAISACLALDASSGKVDEISDPVCLLVWGDISGLQKFIYRLASEGAAKSLRARSFYVQLLSEALADAILLELGLPMTNMIYVGGGGFQMLVHTKAEQTLEQIEPG